MSRRRVCHLIKGLGRGGAESLLPQTIRCGERYEHSVGYFLPWKDALVRELDSIGSPVICFDAPSNARMFARISAVARWILQQEAALVHAHLPLTGVVGRLAARRAGVPMVYTEHNLQSRYHPWTQRANHWTWRLQDQVIAVSEEVSASIGRHLGVQVPVRVVRNGIDVDRLSISPEDGVRARRELGIPLMSPVVGTVAVFRAQKRLDLWLEAASRLARTTEAHFLLVGDGPMLARIQAQAQALDLGSRIHLPGLQEDVRPYLAAMDVYLMSSEFEGLPLALLEALAVGLPVVATAVGGIPEVLPDQESGILVPFGNPEALARAVSRLLEEPELRSKMGQRARQRVAEEFGIERMARELEEVYDRVLL